MIIRLITTGTTILPPPEVGPEVGDAAGDVVGDVVGDAAGDVVGDAIGDAVGDVVGDAAGDVVGARVLHKGSVGLDLQNLSTAETGAVFKIFSMPGPDMRFTVAVPMGHILPFCIFTRENVLLTLAVNTIDIPVGFAPKFQPDIVPSASTNLKSLLCRVQAVP
jgi:hypothetical protein